MSIVDRTHLPEHLRDIKAKKPEERTSIESAALDAYYKVHGAAGVEKIIRVVDVEKAAPDTGKKSTKQHGWKI